MKTIKFNEQELKEIYKTASEKVKKKLEKSYDKEFFIPKKITELVKTFKDAVSICNKLKIDISDIVFEKSDSLSVKAFKQLQIIIRALNEGWHPNWKDSDERKWYPYFVFASGFGFSVTACGCDRTGTGVGSRLCFRSEELARYAGTHFISIYRDFLT